jgi:hypothetical protein
MSNFTGPFEWRDVKPSHYNRYQVKEAQIKGGLIALQVFIHLEREGDSGSRFYGSVTGYCGFKTGVYNSVEEAQDAAENKLAEVA